MRQTPPSPAGNRARAAGGDSSRVTNCVTSSGLASMVPPPGLFLSQKLCGGTLFVELAFRSLFVDLAGFLLVFLFLCVNRTIMAAVAANASVAGSLPYGTIPPAADLWWMFWWAARGHSICSRLIGMSCRTWLWDWEACIAFVHGIAGMQTRWCMVRGFCRHPTHVPHLHACMLLLAHMCSPS